MDERALNQRLAELSYKLTSICGQNLPVKYYPPESLMDIEWMGSEYIRTFMKWAKEKEKEMMLELVKLRKEA